MKTGKFILIYIILGALLVVLFGISICIGSVSVSPADVLKALFGAGDATSSAIVLQLRLPRAVAAAVLGGGLALSGYLLQTFFHNPIAGPFVLGISSGAKLVVALVMVFTMNQLFALTGAVMIAAAFIGSLGAMGFVLILSKFIRRMGILIIGGIMVGYICSAVTDLIVTFADDSNIVNLHNWSKGSFSGISWENVLIMSVVTGVCFIGAFLISKPISAFQMGEGYARSVGVNLRAFKIIIVILSSLLSATVTAFAGPVSFLGVAAPQVVRGVSKTSKPLVLIPMVFLCGSVFCVLSDFIARMLFSPTELSISTVTAILGAPVVIFVILKNRRKEA